MANFEVSLDIADVEIVKVECNKKGELIITVRRKPENKLPTSRHHQNIPIFQGWISD